MKLSKLGICGIISLLSYAVSVFLSPLAYPGYNWMTMAVSELSAVDAPSRALCGQLSSLFGPCGIVSIMAVVLLSIVSLILIIIGAQKENQKSLRNWALICLVAMFAGAIGTNVLPKLVFGIAERMSTFSAVVFNAVLGYYLFTGRFNKPVDVKSI